VGTVDRLNGVKAAIAELDAAYARREHGGLAESKCIDSIREVVH
jgi:hypothetical protein